MFATSRVVRLPLTTRSPWIVALPLTFRVATFAVAPFKFDTVIRPVTFTVLEKVAAPVAPKVVVTDKLPGIATLFGRDSVMLPEPEVTVSWLVVPPIWASV